MTTPLDFEDLVTRHQGAVCAIAYAVLRDRARSEEVAQEAFLVAWQKLPGMVPAPSLPGWVCGIARNLARNAARRRRETAMTTTTDMATEDPSALDQMITHERAELANRALEALSEREREAIVLYYRGDESLGAVAAALGITEAAAKKRVLRGRDHLRAALGEVETTLRGTRPGPAFAAGCVAALALGASAKTASAAAKTTTRASTSTRVRMGIGAAIAVPIISIATIGVGKLATASHASSPQAGMTEPTGLDPRVEQVGATMPHRIDPAARQQLAARIEQVRGKRLAATAPAAAPIMPRIYDFSGSNLFEAIPAPPPAAGSKPSDKRLLRGAIRLVQPLIRECYDHEGHGATGQLDLYVRLEGEPDLGTIATDARVDGEFAKNTALAECVRESLLSIAMPEIEIDGIVDLDYPFTIAR